MPAARLLAYDASSASEEQRAFIDEVLSTRPSVSGPFACWAQGSLELATHAQRLGAACRFRTGLAPRLSELAILVTAAVWRAQAEWAIHEPLARAAGLSLSTCEAVRLGSRPEFGEGDDDEALVYEFARSVLVRKRVSTGLYQRAVQRFGVAIVVNLTQLLGYYTSVAFTLNSFCVREGVDEQPFASDEDDAEEQDG